MQILVNFNIELDERMQDLKSELQSFEGEEYDESHKRKAVDALKRMENWNLFTDTYEVCRGICSISATYKDFYLFFLKTELLLLSYMTDISSCLENEL